MGRYSSFQSAPEAGAAPNAERSAISVIIPTLDEADEIPATLASVRHALGDDIEIIVVDGGSRDGTVDRAAPDARVIVSPPGRGRQLAVGAEAAIGDLLIFLHADTWLAPGARTSLEAVVARPDVAGGCFQLSLRGQDAQHPLARTLVRAINWRSRVFHTATGDQAIFAKRWAYERAGGFPTVELFEDVMLYRRIRRLGQVVVLEPAVRTSDRRWRARGYARTIGLHLLLRLLFLLRVSPSRLNSIYRRAG